MVITIDMIQEIIWETAKWNGWHSVSFRIVELWLKCRHGEMEKRTQNSQFSFSSSLSAKQVSHKSTHMSHWY